MGGPLVEDHPELFGVLVRLQPLSRIFDECLYLGLRLGGVGRLKLEDELEGVFGLVAGNFFFCELFVDSAAFELGDDIDLRVGGGIAVVEAVVVVVVLALVDLLEGDAEASEFGVDIF